MLHIVNKSPFERNALESCLGHAEKGSAVLLIEDGVYAAQAGTAKSGMVTGKAGDLEFYVLKEDLAARGIAEDRLSDGVKVVDYGGFVDLTIEKGPTNSWM